MTSPRGPRPTSDRIKASNPECRIKDHQWGPWRTSSIKLVSGARNTGRERVCQREACKQVERTFATNV